MLCGATAQAKKAKGKEKQDEGKAKEAKEELTAMAKQLKVSP